MNMKPSRPVFYREIVKLTFKPTYKKHIYVESRYFLL